MSVYQDKPIWLYCLSLVIVAIALSFEQIETDTSAKY